MVVALAQDPQNHVHHEYREKHQNVHTAATLLEELRLSLQTAAHLRRHDVRRGFSDKRRGGSDRYAGDKVERKVYRGELVEVIDRLRPDILFPAGDSLKRHKA